MPSATTANVRSTFQCPGLGVSAFTAVEGNGGGRDVRRSRMSFGQASGPPASAKQVRELLALLEAAGHSDFRDARGPMGFTQRQAAGKFTRDEAQEFIDQLEQAAFEADAPSPAPAPPPVARPKAPTASPADRALRAATDDQLAAELRRRGWRTVER